MDEVNEQSGQTVTEKAESEENSPPNSNDDAAKNPTEDEAKPVISVTEYPVRDFVAASEAIFGKKVMPECVIAAFRLSGIEKASKEKAIKIVNDFLAKEVK